jgi:hypothetical protein
VQYREDRILAKSVGFPSLQLPHLNQISSYNVPARPPQYATHLAMKKETPALCPRSGGLALGAKPKRLWKAARQRAVCELVNGVNVLPRYL